MGQLKAVTHHDAFLSLFAWENYKKWKQKWKQDGQTVIPHSVQCSWQIWASERKDSI